MKSIIQNEKKCYITNTEYNLHEHHIFGGGRRKLSEKYGLKIWLRFDWHNGAKYGVHFNKKLDLELKQTAQGKAMQHYNWSIEDFIKIIGKNYL